MLKLIRLVFIASSISSRCTTTASCRCNKLFACFSGLTTATTTATGAATSNRANARNIYIIHFSRDHLPQRDTAVTLNPSIIFELIPYIVTEVGTDKSIFIHIVKNDSQIHDGCFWFSVYIDQLIRERNIYIIVDSLFIYLVISLFGITLRPVNNRPASKSVLIFH